MYLQLASDYIMRCARAEMSHDDYSRFYNALLMGCMGATSQSHTAYVLKMIAERHSPTLAAQIRTYFNYVEFMSHLKCANDAHGMDIFPPNLPDPEPNPRKRERP